MRRFHVLADVRIALGIVVLTWFLIAALAKATKEAIPFRKLIINKRYSNSFIRELMRPISLVLNISYGLLYVIFRRLLRDCLGVGDS